MAIYTTTSAAPTAIPEGAVESSWDRNEPLIDSARLRKQFLWGIPLVSAMKDPETGKYLRMDDETLKE